MRTSQGWPRVLVVGLGLAAAVLGPTLVPSPQYFSFHSVVGLRGGIGGGPFECVGILPAAGTPIYFRWSAPTNINFEVWRCTTDRNSSGVTIYSRPVYQENGTAGSGTVVAAGGTYFFGTYCPYVGEPPPPCVASNVSGYYFGTVLSYTYNPPQVPGR